MAFTARTAGTTVYSANGSGTTVAPTPSSATAIGDRMVLLIGSKPDTISMSTPSGWELVGTISGGAGTTGADTGPMTLTVFTKIAASAGTADAPGTITITSNNVSAAQILSYGHSASNTSEIVFTGAADTTTGTPMSAVMPLNPGMTVGDYLIACGVIPTDVTTPAQFTSETVAATGMTTVTLTEVTEWETTNNNDMGGWVAHGPVVTGTSSAAPTVSATAAATNTNVAGPIGLIRLREIPATATVNASDSGTLSSTDASSVDNGSRPEFIVGTSISYNNTTASFTVPAGVQATDTAVFVIGGSTSWPASVTLSKAGVTFTEIQPLATATNMWHITYKATGLVAGDTVNVSQSISQLTIGAHFYFVNGIDVVGAVGNRGGVSQTTVVAPSITTTAGQRVFLVAMDRSTTVTGVPSRANSNSNTFASEFFMEESGASLTSINLASSTIAGTSSGTTTVTYGVASTNALAYHFSMLSAGGPSTVSGSDSGTFDVVGTATIAASSTSTDTGTISATDVSVVTVSLTRADTGTLSATESTSTFVSSAVNTSDTGTVSATESVAIITTSPTTDSGTLSTTETSAISGTTVAVDSGTLSVSETSAVVVTTSANDTGTLSATESTSFAQVAFTRTDTGTLSATEGATVGSSAATLSGSDSGILTTGSGAYGEGNYGEGAYGASGAENETTQITAQFGATDTGTFSATEGRSVSGTTVASDTGTWSATEGRVLDGSSTSTDTGTISATDSSYVASALTRTDTGTFSVTESTTVAITVVTSDSGILSAVETTSLAVTASTTDTGTISAIESRVTAGSSTSTDTGTVSATETSGVSGTVNASDTGTISATDASSVSANFSVINASDSGILSAVETAQIGSPSPGSETGAISATDVSAVLVIASASDSGTFSGTETTQFGLLVKTANDAGSISATESVSTVVNISSTDTGTLSATEGRSSSGTMATNDGGTLSASESTLKFVQLPSSDTGTFYTYSSG